MNNDEQAYPLSPQFEHGWSDLAAPLRIIYTGYYNYIHTQEPIQARPRCWYLQLMNYRNNPGSNRLALEAGQFVLRRPDESYLLHLPRGERAGYYWIFFTGYLAEQLVSSCNLKPNQVYTLQEDSLQLIRQDFDLLFRECSQKKPGYDQLISASLITILVHLSRGHRVLPTKSAEYSHLQVEKTMLYIQGNFSNCDLSVAELAARVHLSVSRYRELFHECAGVSPQEYIIQQRINHACTLLQNTGLNILQITTYCGYQDASYFGRLFRDIRVDATRFEEVE